jgi:hypothetical protein
MRQRHTLFAVLVVAAALHLVDTTYTTSSSLGHTHQVTLTAGQLLMLASGGSVTATSSVSTVTGSHSHDITFQGKK